MGETHDRRGFFPSLSRTAFTRAVFQSNVFLPKLNALRIPVSFHTALKTAEFLAFLDSGATECFVSQRFIDTHKLGTRLLTVPRKLQNADGSPNAGGGLTHFTELEVLTGVMTVCSGLLFFSSTPSPLPCGLRTSSPIYYMPYPRLYCTTHAHISTC
jgi:hypothetical protein